MNNLKARAQLYLKQMNIHLKPRRRKLLHHRSNVKSNIPTLKQADQVEKTLTSFHKRVKSKKKKHLFDLFAQNITLFERLNSQKSTYQQLFSKNKQNRQTKQPKKKLKRCTSAHVNRTKTFEDQYYEYRESDFMKRKRPFSSHSSKNQLRVLTIQSQF